MGFEWIEEASPRWDADKRAMIGDAPAGVFDARFARLADDDRVPGSWWRVEDGGRVVGYGWLDVVWGDAEITLVTRATERGRGVGAFVLEHLEDEAKRRGINYLYNTVRPNHPEHDRVSAWLQKRGFSGSEDGSLFRTLTHRTPTPHGT